MAVTSLQNETKWCCKTSTAPEPMHSVKGINISGGQYSWCGKYGLEAPSPHASGLTVIIHILSSFSLLPNSRSSKSPIPFQFRPIRPISPSQTNAKQKHSISWNQKQNQMLHLCHRRLHCISRRYFPLPSSTFS
jgi:hypothetical protein